jgi:hypothetical protein
MLRIPTRLAPSRIPGAGLGLFTRDAAPAGALIWRFDPGLDVVLRDLPADPLLRRFVEVYGYMPLDGAPRWVVCLDDARFINHSDAPNTEDTEEITTAARDLTPGEEITSDYRRFCRRPFEAWAAAVPPGG